MIPCEYCKLIKSGNQVPPRSDVAGYENRKCEDREGVHESFPIAGASLKDCAIGKNRERFTTKPTAEGCSAETLVVGGVNGGRIMNEYENV